MKALSAKVSLLFIDLCRRCEEAFETGRHTESIVGLLLYSAFTLALVILAKLGGAIFFGAKKSSSRQPDLVVESRIAELQTQLDRTLSSSKEFMAFFEKVLTEVWQQMALLKQQAAKNAKVLQEEPPNTPEGRGDTLTFGV